MLECVLVFCNQSGLRDIGFSSILEGLLNLEALTFKQARIYREQASY